MDRAGLAGLGDRADLAGLGDRAAPVGPGDRAAPVGPGVPDHTRKSSSWGNATLGLANWLDGGARELRGPVSRYTG